MPLACGVGYARASRFPTPVTQVFLARSRCYHCGGRHRGDNCTHEGPVFRKLQLLHLSVLRRSLAAEFEAVVRTQGAKTTEADETNGGAPLSSSMASVARLPYICS